MPCHSQCVTYFIITIITYYYSFSFMIKDDESVNRGRKKNTHGQNITGICSLVTHTAFLNQARTAKGFFLRGMNCGYSRLDKVHLLIHVSIIKILTLWTRNILYIHIFEFLWNDQLILWLYTIWWCSA